MAPDQPAYDRAKAQPGLHMAAQEACVTLYTNGFCVARQHPGCTRCWPAAEAVIKATGMSARAVTWIFAHRSRIEEAAKIEYNAHVAFTKKDSAPQSPAPEREPNTETVIERVGTACGHDGDWQSGYLAMCNHARALRVELQQARSELEEAKLEARCANQLLKVTATERDDWMNAAERVGSEKMAAERANAELIERCAKAMRIFAAEYDGQSVEARVLTAAANRIGHIGRALQRTHPESDAEKVAREAGNV